MLRVQSPQNLSVESITFVEDPNHPESWLRNIVMQVWDPAKGVWADCPPLLSDSAWHTMPEHLSGRRPVAVAEIDPKRVEAAKGDFHGIGTFGSPGAAINCPVLPAEDRKKLGDMYAR